jgi:hypothetical protein
MKLILCIDASVRHSLSLTSFLHAMTLPECNPATAPPLPSPLLPFHFFMGIKTSISQKNLSFFKKFNEKGTLSPQLV